MDREHTSTAESVVEHVVKLEEELEAAGLAMVGGDTLESARAILHKWVDTMTGVVVSPALGRVTLVHSSGRHSTISSSDLPFAMSKPLEAYSER